MKLRLVLKTKTKKGKDVNIKFNLAPSKHIGFINFVNLALSQDNPVSISFEKVSKTGEKEESKIAGSFKFQALKDAEQQLEELRQEIDEKEKKRKKQAQRRKKT